MKRFVVALVVVGLLMATTASGAVAKTTKIEVAGTATTRAETPGTSTWVGTVQSVRGMVLERDGVWNSVYLTGPQVDIVNYDLDFNTGQGEMWGSDHHDVTAVAGGGWDCRYHATITAFVARGNSVCQGTGTLHTWQLRADLYMSWGPWLTLISPRTEFTGYFFAPGH